MNGWTEKQYAIFRAVFGAYLCAHFLLSLPWATEVFSSAGVLPDRAASPLIHAFPNVLALVDAPWAVSGLVVVAALASVLLAAGRHDRIAALVVWYASTCLFGRNPLTSSPHLPYLGWMLLAHAATPRGTRPEAIHRAAWIVLAVAYGYSGYTKLVSPSWIDGSAVARVLDCPLARPGPLRELMKASPALLLKLATWSALALETGFAPLALWRRARPWIWAAMLLLHVSLLFVVAFPDLSTGMILMHFYTFDPAWLAPRTAGTERILYDGGCGLCHGFVKFVLAEDRAAVFRFAPLADERASTIVLETAKGRLERSDAVLRVLAGLGGLWRLAAFLARPLPRGLRDRVYDAVARRRRTFFAAPETACPVVPRELRARFDAQGA